MSEHVLVTQGLTKSYGSCQAVKGLDLEVRRGEVFGFLGPNGAGKTTTIRMCLGLIRPTSGRVLVLGRDVGRYGAEVLPRVGALIESPALYPYMSGRDNLLCFADTLCGVPKRRIDELLDLVDLRDRQRDRVQGYSQGMKQRLGLAVAMLHDPEILILDEPANGLDPAGIVEMRSLLRRLAGQGKTIFFSSHVLAEVQQTCDRVAILHLGELIKVAPMGELLHGSGEFKVRVANAIDALAVIRRQPWGRAARELDGMILTASPSGRGRELTEFLVAAGFTPDAVIERAQDLEEVFLQLTGGESR
ncbi:MAG TPA: ABC transporter ATP-binding protein [Candidatus Dormibacteraeota bacterium]|nr:ABC transporter ATP-binding protein [Candidatus Dormibacteraeota bacterium]